MLSHAGTQEVSYNGSLWDKQPNEIPRQVSKYRSAQVCKVSVNN